METALLQLASRGPTAKLWVQYFNQVTLMKNFIAAERMADWSLHLQSVRNMRPYFHSAGHFQYAKSTHLFLQEMMELETTLSEAEFTKFKENGYYTIRSCLLYTSPSPRDRTRSRMPSSA